MEHYLLAPLYSLIQKERPQDPDELSAANLVALRLLTGPYLGRSYASWGIANVGAGNWCLAQEWDNEVIDRDALEPFHRSWYGHDEYDEDQAKDIYAVDPPRHVNRINELQSGEDHVPQPIRDRADAMLERLRALHPEAVSQLLSPTAEQLQRRQDIQVVAVRGRQFSEHLRPIIGDWADWSLRAYGIKYHNPSYTSGEDFYFLAHNGTEVCGVMKLGTARGWGYGVSFVSVSPGFRGQGLSLRLYEAAIAQCLEDGKALIRSDPGEGTPPQATLAYDRLVKASPVIHTSSNGALTYPLQQVFEKGWPYATLVERLKDVCDEAIPSPERRMERYTGSFDYEAAQAFREKHAAVFDELLKGPPSLAPRKPGMKLR